MIPRYRHKGIAEIWDNRNKLNLWQETELSVISARCQLEIYPTNVFDLIASKLKSVPINLDEWLAIEEKTKHDLNAFILERVQHLDRVLHQYFHERMTSYDTEEAPMSLMLLSSLAIVDKACLEMLDILVAKIRRYRYTPMLGRTHGQEAKLQSLGKRFYGYYVKLMISYLELQKAKEYIYFSKLSGAIGNYQGVSPNEEKVALEILGLKPFIGASQIMPRQLHQPVANALAMIVGSLSQIALDIRLGARSGNKIFQEFFDKKQMGSSAMPHKKNTISSENQEGMLILMECFTQALRRLMVTWEERSIEQSSVERIVWPDLFHVVMQSFKNMKSVVGKLMVFQDNMLLEIINCRGCWASEDAKEWLMKVGEPYGLTYEDAYRTVQVAAENVNAVTGRRKDIRNDQILSYEHAEAALKEMMDLSSPVIKDEIAESLLRVMPDSNKILALSQKHDKETIEDLILGARICYSEELAFSREQIEKWNDILREIFRKDENVKAFHQLFSIIYQLRNEYFLFEDLPAEATA
jgi:adenylosuccinate lyase